MTTSLWVTLILGIGGSGGIAAVVSAIIGSRSNRAKAEVDARAQATNEFNAIMAAQQLRIDGLAKEMTEVKQELTRFKLDLREAEDYIDILILGISNGSIPPIPSRRQT